MAVQQGEKLEQAGNFKGALAKLRAAATVLDQITRQLAERGQPPDRLLPQGSRTQEGIGRGAGEDCALLGAGKAETGEAPSMPPVPDLALVSTE